MYRASKLITPSNLTSDAISSYVYDAEYGLVSRSGGVGLSCDPHGRLWQVGGPSGTTVFEYDGDRLLQEYRPDGTARLYAHGAGADEPLVAYRTGGATTPQSMWRRPTRR